MFAAIRMFGLMFFTLGCLRAEEQRFVFERPLMGTRFAITCYGTDETEAKKAAGEAFGVGMQINAVASDYLPDSELMQLSNKIGEPVKVSPLMAELLEASFAMAEASEGVFDPTIGPLTKLWRETRKTAKLPSEEVLAAAKARCGWKDAVWDKVAKTILFKKPGMQLDLGGIAKGFAADKMYEVMLKRGFPRTIIAAGGDLRLGDPPLGKTAWRVGLQTFHAEEPEEVVELANCAVSTSGDLHQFVEIEGKRYSHIIDPKTGLGMTEHVAVSVISPKGVLSDGLDTTACLLGAEKAEEFAMKHGATRAIVRTENR
jgi:thiamine biosynthesis lipoprotein